MTSIRLGAMIGVLAAFAVAPQLGCSGDVQSEQTQAGTLQLALTGVSNTGSTYRLSNGTFTVTGPTNTQLFTDTDPNAPSIQADLPAGDYTIALAEGWVLEKEVNGMFVPTQSTLTSPNPIAFSISSFMQTGVLFEFQSEGEIVEMGDGTLEVDIAVDDLECAAPAVLCSGTCVDTASDPNNCGNCGTVCDVEGASAVCDNGSCVVGMCEPGLQDCDMSSANGCEVATANDVSHCGGCGTVCPSNGGVSSCMAGNCGISCNPGFGNCTAAPGCETLTNSNLQHCGTCGNVCNAPNSQPLCQAGMCAIGSCIPAFANCDNQVMTGCETLMDSNPGCAQAMMLGQVSGDLGSNQLFVSDFGERRYRVNVNESDQGLLPNDLAVRFTLSYPPGTQYMLEAGCDGCVVNITNNANPAAVTLRWQDNLATNSSRDVFVNVVYQSFSGSPSPSVCQPWQLTAVGNVNGGQDTCSPL